VPFFQFSYFLPGGSYIIYHHRIIIVCLSFIAEWEFDSFLFSFWFGTHCTIDSGVFDVCFLFGLDL